MLGGFQNSMSSNRDAARRRLRGFPVGCGSSDLEVTPAAVACQVIMANFRSLGMQVVVTEPCRTREAGTKGPGFVLLLEPPCVVALLHRAAAPDC
jgi:hypothetical protein